MLPRLALLFVSTMLLGACATAPEFNLAGVDRTLTPAGVTDLAAARDKRVLWGGLILGGRNLKDSTQLEVLAYPLDSDGRPDADAATLGRFLLVRAGYLEKLDYAPGRQLTAVGPVTELVKARIGEADYQYPLMRAEQLHLWPRRTGREPQMHFGVGVTYGR